MKISVSAVSYSYYYFPGYFYGTDFFGCRKQTSP